MFYMAAIAIVIIILLRLRLARQRRRAGIQGWVVSQDLDGRSHRIYRNEQAGITCKPDVVERERLIEYKSASVTGQAKPGDILQVAAQMIATGVKEAELRYAQGKKFCLRKNSPQMQAAMRKVVNIVNSMKWHLRTRIAPKGTPSPHRCSVCIYKTECPEAVQ